MQRITLGQRAIHYRGCLSVIEIKLVDSINLHGCWREIIIIIERAKEITLIVLSNLFAIFSLLTARDDPGKNWL